MWYFRFAGQPLKDSRFGKIAQFQRALSTALTERGQTGVGDDGIYGKLTRGGIVRLCDLADFSELRVPETDPHFGAMSLAIWDRLMVTVAAPSVHERAFVISLSHEGTDYDQVEWNLGTSDNESVLTWGPYGATVGHGREVQGILRRVADEDNQILPEAFGSEFPVLEQLLEGEHGKNLLEPIHENVARRQNWVQAFHTLGGEPAVREEYEAYAFATDEWLRPPIRRLYQELIPAASQAATVVDYGFFLDLAMHLSITKKRVTTAHEAILSEELQLGRPLRSAERRRLISRTMVPGTQKKDRLGRNVVFYVDDVGEEGLTSDERSAWEQRTGRRASDCGLTDEAQFFPEFLV
jgi:hypothetical protein